MDDFSRPQPFNVEIGAHEIADETAARSMPVPPALYAVPEVVHIHREPNLYPEPKYGMQGPRLRPRTWRK